MLKTIKAKKLTFADKLGAAVFEGVSVAVDADSGITSETFDEKKHEYALAGNVINGLARVLAVRWLERMVTERRDSITPTELLGVQLALGVKATEFAELLGLGKAAVSRIYKGTLKVNKPTTRLAVMLLRFELKAPGGARSLLDGDAALVVDGIEGQWPTAKKKGRAA